MFQIPPSPQGGEANAEDKKVEKDKDEVEKQEKERRLSFITFNTSGKDTAHATDF